MRGLARNGTTCDTRNVNVSMVPTAGVATDHGRMEKKSVAMGLSMEVGKPAVEHEKTCTVKIYPMRHGLVQESGQYCTDRLMITDPIMNGSTSTGKSNRLNIINESVAVHGAGVWAVWYR